MKVLISGDGTAASRYTSFHRDANCSGLRKGEVAHGATYNDVDLDDLPETVQPCRFECCYPGATTASLKRRVHDARKPKTGLQVGQTVTYRELGESETTTWRLVDGPTDVDRRELSIKSPIAKSLIDMHGGTFTLKSKLRIGTEVIVTFPPERVMSALAPMAEEAPPLQPDPTVTATADVTDEVSMYRVKKV